jgi:hypothetical protein
MFGVRGVAVVLGALFAAGMACSSSKSGHKSMGAPTDDGGSAEAGDDAGVGDDGASGDGDDGGAEAGSNCTYPKGPYGKAMGMVVSPNLTWQGYLPGATAVSTLKSTDLYDCDGTKNINAILFDEAALWCGPCQMEASANAPLVKTGGKWLTEGVAWVSLVIQDLNMAPATIANANTWRIEFKLQGSYVFADPGFDFGHSGQNGLPTNILVDPRTMKIVNIVEGYGGPDDQSIDQLAAQNKGH